VAGGAALVALGATRVARAQAKQKVRFSAAFTEQDLLVVQVPKRAKHPLVMICAALLAAEINIHYAYPLLISPAGPALALYVDDPTLAAQLFIRKGFTLLGESDLSK